MSTTLYNVLILSFGTKIVNTSLCFRVRESAKVESNTISFWTTGRLFVTTTQRSGKNTKTRRLQKSNGQLQPTQICRGTLRGRTCPVLSDSRTNNHPSGVEAVEIHTVTLNHMRKLTAGRTKRSLLSSLNCTDAWTWAVCTSFVALALILFTSFVSSALQRGSFVQIQR